MQPLALRIRRRAAALLAAQLMAESNFDPYASSPAGAEGIAQFVA
jgi:soluble lytic murein transglycosylase-like protein